MTSDRVQVSDQQALVIELMQALESGVHGDELRRFFHDDAEQIEYPSLVDPRVGRRELDGMITASELGAGMLAFQRYDVSRWIESEDTVVCQAEWYAELAKDAGTLHQGQRLHTYSVLIFTFRDDKIIRQEAYDCYEPFVGAF
ncbi:MAG TPA: nuclear transport factor 2 family protein [Propionibacteriaceae bacterium]|nr:nuclear transport factor 2 family protein [Propionibacteriaceae bacterium]